MREPDIAPVDPFDLPDWIGVEPVTWTAETSLGTAHQVTGALHATSGDGGTSTHACDLLAGDLAYPAPALTETWRSAAHQAWSLGEVLLLSYDGRLTLVVPGTTVTAEPALEAVRRLAKAVGAPAERFTVALRL